MSDRIKETGDTYWLADQMAVRPPPTADDPDLTREEMCVAIVRRRQRIYREHPHWMPDGWSAERELADERQLRGLYGPNPLSSGAP